MNELKKQANIIKVLCKNDKYYIFTILNNIKRNDPGLLRLITDYRDEFEKLLDTPITEEDEQNYKNLETKADNIISKRLEKNLKKLQEKVEKEKKEKEMEKEKNIMMMVNYYLKENILFLFHFFFHLNILLQILIDHYNIIFLFHVFFHLNIHLQIIIYHL